MRTTVATTVVSRARATDYVALAKPRLNVLVEATAFAAALCVAGLLILAAGVNVLAAAVALATLGSYAVVYTPLKRRTSFATVIGAIPGALPAVIGWTAADDALSQGAWVLFAIVFLWQL